MRTRIIHAVAGFMIITSLLLGIHINSNWFWLAGFVGANLFQYAFTDWCLLNEILIKLGIKN